VSSSNTVPNEEIVTDSAEGAGRLPTISFDQLERIAKAFIFIAGMFYAFGVMVSNLYYLSLGISDFSSLRPKYVITGGWSVLFLLFAALPATLPTLLAASCGELKIRIKKSQARIKGWHFILMAIFGVILAGVLTTTMSALLGVRDFGRWPEFVVSAGAAANSLVMVGVGLVLFHRSGANPISSVGLWCVVPIMSFIGAYGIATCLYDQIAEGVGGGKPIAAEVVLNKDGMAFWKATGAIPVGEGSMRTGKVKILYQNDKEIVLRAQYLDGQKTKEKIIILNKTLVDGLLPTESN
jgi:hypothetical protein